MKNIKIKALIIASCVALATVICSCGDSNKNVNDTDSPYDERGIIENDMTRKMEDNFDSYNNNGGMDGANNYNGNPMGDGINGTQSSTNTIY